MKTYLSILSYFFCASIVFILVDALFYLFYKMIKHDPARALEAKSMFRISLCFFFFCFSLVLVSYFVMEVM